jgi:predicted nucleotidyltransferase
MADGATARLPQGLDGVVRELAGRFRPERLILFGSYAFGRPHAASDIDLLVVVSDPPPREEVWRVAQELGSRLAAPLQIIVMTPREYEETREVVGGLASPAHHRGIPLYEAPR